MKRARTLLASVSTTTVSAISMPKHRTSARDLHMQALEHVPNKANPLTLLLPLLLEYLIKLLLLFSGLPLNLLFDWGEEKIETEIYSYGSGKLALTPSYCTLLCSPGDLNRSNIEFGWSDQAISMTYFLCWVPFSSAFCDDGHAQFRAKHPKLPFC
ncbi:hypothetical protein ACLOJK_031091 [Asimina triloba]